MTSQSKQIELLTQKLEESHHTIKILQNSKETEAPKPDTPAPKLEILPEKDEEEAPPLRGVLECRSCQAPSRL